MNKPDYPERPEADFSLPSDYDCRGRTQCAHCGHIVLQVSAFRTGDEDYCGELCASEAALDKLRETGL